MRAKRSTQISLFDHQAIDYFVADEFEWASAWIDRHPDLIDNIDTVVNGKAAPGLGNHDLTCESVLRCAVFMQLRKASYRELVFSLNESLSERGFEVECQWSQALHTMT